MDLTTYFWPSLPVPLITRTHDVQPQAQLTMMETGRIRKRPIRLLPFETIKGEWHFLQDEFDAFIAFYEKVLLNGSLHFRMVTYDPTDNPSQFKEVTRELGFMAPYSFTYTDGMFAVTATLEVVDETFDLVAPP